MKALLSALRVVGRKLFRFFCGVYAALAVPFAFLFIYTGAVNRLRWYYVFIGAAMLGLHILICSRVFHIGEPDTRSFRERMGFK